MKKYFSILFLLVFVLLTFNLNVFAGGNPKGDVAPSATHPLKKYMAKFGTLVAGLEILKIKEKKPDWASIDYTLNEMNKILKEMQDVDTTNAYKEYTDLLANSLADIKKLSDKKDIHIYDAFDKLSNTCFQCHAAHRPADFLKPKKNQQLSESK